MTTLPKPIAEYIATIGDPATHALCVDAAEGVLLGRKMPPWRTMPPLMQVVVRMAREADAARWRH